MLPMMSRKAETSAQGLILFDLMIHRSAQLFSICGVNVLTLIYIPLVPPKATDLVIKAGRDLKILWISTGVTQSALCWLFPVSMIFGLDQRCYGITALVVVWT
jgi:tryptophan synthase alpha subunit